MVKKRGTRAVKARRWVMAGAVASAVAGSAHAGEISGDQPGDLDIAAQGEFVLASAEGEGGGEGEGEGEGRAAVDPEIQLLSDLGFMQGHAYAGLQLYEMGETELGVEHIGHPIIEKYEAVAEPVERLGYSGLKAQLEAMSEAAEAGQPVEVVAALYEEMTATLERIRAETKGGPASELRALALLTRIAGDEYQAAFRDGEMVNAQEYQDSWGFIQIVKFEARELAESDDGDVARAAVAILGYAENAESVYGGVKGDDVLEPNASAIYGAAARMEIAAGRLG